MNVINEEKDLIDKLRSGSQPAFTALYNLYSGRLLGRLIRLTKSETIAVEILQEVFIKIWNTRANIDPDNSFRSYLFRITENLVVDHYRKAVRDKKLLDHLCASAAVAYSLPEEELYRKENMTILQGIIDHLPAQRKNVFYAR